MFVPTKQSPKVLQTLRMTRDVHEQIQRTIGLLPAEQGGILGGSRAEGVVRCFHFDQFGHRTGATYSPDVTSLNTLLHDEWNPRDINMLGFVHSHPGYLKRPSAGDLEYARRILEHNIEMDHVLLPIVIPEPDGGDFEIHAYAAVRNGQKVRVQQLSLELVEPHATEDDALVAAPDAQQMPRRSLQPISACHDSPLTRPVVDFVPQVGFIPVQQTFDRVRKSYDLGRLSSSRAILAGVGGALQFADDLARAGVGEFVLIDPDVVSDSNLATQQTYRRDLGRWKVDVAKERILDINPHAIVRALPQKLEAIDDAAFAELASAPWRQWSATAPSPWGLAGAEVPVVVSVPPAVTLLCGLTDSFPAQARVNRLALQFALPSLAAQVYHEGRGGEITFTYPGITPACHRCALSSRYRAYLQDGYQNQVTSHGTPIFSTTRLNALKGFLAMAILHHGTDHARWGGLLERIGNRNLIQIRMDPDLPLGVFQQVLGGGDQQRILFDDVVWLPQQADNPANGYPTCPDCGGTGDLRKAKDTINDTRTMRQ